MSTQVPMHERRPEWLEKAIASDFANAQSRRNDYCFNGDGPDYDFFEILGGSDHTSFASALETVQGEEQLKGRKLRILDVGAGEAGTALSLTELGHEVDALSAHDYANNAWSDNPAAAKLPAERYHVGDAHQLAEITNLRMDYDVIISRLCFAHLIDPLGALEQTLSRLALGGVAVLDALSKAPLAKPIAYADDVTARSVALGIEDLGFNLFGSIPQNHPRLFLPFVARRTAITPLVFPFAYRNTPGERARD